MDADVIIVGGAVAGGTLANALGSSGVQTLLIEKVSREVHSTRGDLLHPPTLRLLDGWGVLAALHADGALPIEELAVSHARRGLVARFPVPAAGPGPAGRTIAVPHDRIEAVLWQCAERWPSVRTERGQVTDLVFDGGRVIGVTLRPHAEDRTRELRARLVVGCDGSQSLVRRTLGIAAEQHPYAHEQVIIGGEGPTELPAALHWYLDDFGPLAVASRPRGGFRILLTLQLGQRGDLLKRTDPALRQHVVGRFPMLEPLRFGKQDAHLYRLGRHVAERFWGPGAALVGDAAHATHPAGATGMSLAISGAARLAELVAPVLRGEHAGDDAALDARLAVSRAALDAGSAAYDPVLDGRLAAYDASLDGRLAAYDAERRPAARLAIERNHQQALRIWQSDLYCDPEAYARAIDPRGAWGVGGAGWGQDPAALSVSATAERAV
jgi:2-polyprenyl-6-methoxyphenol hydroxylase-like FAD-dependent oxidoreductase